MGNLLFIILHVLALMFGAVLLFITIPLHLVYAALAGRNKPAPSGKPIDAASSVTHVRCPDCPRTRARGGIKVQALRQQAGATRLSRVRAALDADASNRSMAKFIVIVVAGLALGAIYFATHR